ncbi:MAG: flippase activity-associated protein Agl23, partial [Anaerolineales bacterium]
MFAVLLILAIFTRFYDLGERVMSHDETTHVYFSWLLYKGQGYSHHPLSHGPLQFHLLALSYFLFGDNDFSARVPQALFGVGAIAFMWAFRRYLGRIGALVAAFLFLISPYMMYYARYARNESFVMLLGLIMLWAILRYLDRGEPKYLYVFTAALALHFTAKETSFIYAAQALLFLGLLFLWRITNRKWGNKNLRSAFFLTLFLSAALFVIALGTQIALSQPGEAVITGTEVQEPAVAGETEAPAAQPNIPPITLILAGAAIGVLLGSLYFLIRGYGWDRLRKERSLNLLLLLFTLVLPHLAAFPVYWLGRDPMNYTDTNNLVFIGLIVAVLAAISIAIGLSWSRRLWLANVAVFYIIFVPLYTTIFTNGVGFFSGLVGSLGYWLEQQGVERGSQPSYFYWGVQIPIYEFVALAGALLAVWIGTRLWRADRVKKKSDDTERRNLRPAESRRLALWLLAFWSVTSVVAYTVAGEKMPWLTSHIALPLILLAGWALGWVIKRVDWDKALKPRGMLIAALMVVFLLAILAALGALLSTRPPFQGQETVNLAATYRFMFLVILSGVSGYAIYSLVSGEKWNDQQVSHMLILVVFAGLAFLGARAALRASFINYDSATEYLVYAHMARGPGEIMDQVEEISVLTTDGLDLQVAYDNETSYPFWWYLRNYPNQRYYADQPNRDLRQAPVILVGDANYGKIEPVVGQAYYMFEFVRIWWPNQDYFEFTPDAVRGQFASEAGEDASQMGMLDYLRLFWQRLYGYLGNPQLREGIWQIWLNRNFRPYLEAKGQDPS